MKRIIFVLTVAALITALFFVSAEKKSKEISASLVRLHVVANSDSPQDQALKLRVRDAICEACGTYFCDAKNKEDAERIIASHENDLKRVAEETLRSSGSSESVTVAYQKTAFPTKHYENFSLPAGEYDALNIKIGEAAGQNWWCVLFPPLCFVDAAGGNLPPESEAMLIKSLGSETYTMLTAKEQDANFDIKLKFKLLEYIGGMTARAREK